MMRTVCMQVISRKLFSGITCSTIKELQILIPWSKMKLKGSRKNKMRKSRTNNLVFTYYHNNIRSEEHTSELQSRPHLVCRLLLEKKKKKKKKYIKTEK